VERGRDPAPEIVRSLSIPALARHLAPERLPEGNEAAPHGGSITVASRFSRFLAELKRRSLKEAKIVQWALAYLAGAFVVFQLLDALAEPLGLPAGAQRGVLVIVGVGFFVTLVLAWYHGEKGRQRVSGPELVMVAALLVVAGVALSMLRGTRAETEPGALPGSVTTSDDRPSIAILPCDNFSPKAEDAFRADGIHEEILLQLQRISSIRSIGRTSVLQFAEDPPPVDEIAQALGVGFVGECSVLKDPDQTKIRVTFQLLDATGAQRWADRYDRDLTVADIYDIQGDIARRVASSVGAVLTPAEEDRLDSTPTDNLRAYDLYTQGRLLWWSRGPEALERAIGLFQAAIAEDSTFAKAWAGLAETYVILPELVGSSPGELLPLAREAIEAALALDPDLAEAHTASGYIHALEWEWEAAEEDYLRAIELSPDYGTAHQWYAEMLAPSGRWEEAFEETRRAIELDPRSPAINSIMGTLLAYTRRPAEAIPWFERSIAIAPEFVPPLFGLAFSYQSMGAYEEAASWYRRYAMLPGFDLEAAQAFLAALEDPVSRPRAIRRLRASEDHDRAARYLAVLGDADGAIAALEQAFDEHARYLPWANSIPDYDEIRGDPRFQDLVRRMGFEP